MVLLGHDDCWRGEGQLMPNRASSPAKSPWHVNVLGFLQYAGMDCSRGERIDAMCLYGLTTWVEKWDSLNTHSYPPLVPLYQPYVFECDSSLGSICGIGPAHVSNPLANVGFSNFQFAAPQALDESDAVLS